jgi:hypothetical protein
MEFKVGDVVRVKRYPKIVRTISSFDRVSELVYYKSGGCDDIKNIELHLETPAPDSILTEAAKIAGVDRSESYGHPLANHDRIAGLWQAYLDAKKPGDLTPQDVARMMILLKVARDLHAPRRDNRVDICGYAQCLDLMEESTK